MEAGSTVEQLGEVYYTLTQTRTKNWEMEGRGNRCPAVRTTTIIYYRWQRSSKTTAIFWDKLLVRT